MKLFLSLFLLTVAVSLSAQDGTTFPTNVFLKHLPGSGDHVAVRADGLLMRTNIAGGSGTPGGSTFSLQYNGTNTLAGDTNFTYVPFHLDGGDPISPTWFLTYPASGVTNFVSGTGGFGTLSGTPMYLTTSNSVRWILGPGGTFYPNGSNLFSIGTHLLPAATNYAQHFSAKDGMDIAGGGGAIIGLKDADGTNVNLRIPNMDGFDAEFRWFKNTNAGVMVSLSETGTNQFTNITLTANQVVTGNGSGGYAAINLPSAPGVTNISAFSETFGGTLANWQAQSNATWVIASGQLLVFPSGLFGSYLRYTNYFTGFASWRLTCDVKPLAINATSYGLGIGLRASGGLYWDGADRNLFMQLRQDTGAEGTLGWWNGTSNALVSMTSSSSGMGMTVSANDTIKVTIERQGSIYTAFCSNTANATVAFSSYSASIKTNIYGFPPYVGHVAFWSIGGSQAVDNVQFTLRPYLPLSTLLVSDSIGAGFGAENIEDGTAIRLSRDMHDDGVQSLAVGSLSVSTANSLLPEIALLAPSNVVMMIGGNDVLFGHAAAVYQSNYAYFAANVSKSGRLFHCLSTPRDGTDVTPLAQWQSTNYAYTSIIDTYNALKETNGLTTLRFEYDWDGTHPNSSGHAVIARMIERALKSR